MKTALLLVGILVSYQSALAQETTTDEVASQEYNCVSSISDEVSEVTLTGDLAADNWQLVGEVKPHPNHTRFPLDFLLSRNVSQDGLAGSQDMATLGRYRFYAEASTQYSEFSKDLFRIKVGWGHDCNCPLTVTKMICIGAE